MSDSIVENQVVVNIFGEEYPITAATDPEHIARVADLVDSRMREISKASRSKAKDKLAILTALSFASELAETGDDLSSIQDGYSARLDGLITSLDLVLSESK